MKKRIFLVTIECIFEGNPGAFRASEKLIREHSPGYGCGGGGGDEFYHLEYRNIVAVKPKRRKAKR